MMYAVSLGEGTIIMEVLPEVEQPVSDKDVKSLPVDLLHAKIFSPLSMQELVELARVDIFFRNVVHRYFKKILRSHALPLLQKQLLNAIQNNNIEKLQGVLNNPAFNPIYLNPVPGFDPLLYANLNGFTEILDAIYARVSALARGNPAQLANLLRVHIRTSAYFSEAIAEDFERAIAAQSLDVDEALGLACQFGRREVVNYLCKKHDPMKFAIQTGALERVQELIAFGAKPSGVDEPLTGMSEVVRAAGFSAGWNVRRLYGLRNAGAYVRLRALDSNHVPLSFYEEAIRTGQNNTARYLVDLSMDDITSAEFNNGRVFAITCRYGNTEMLRYLLEKTEGRRDKIDLTAVDEEVGTPHRTALQHACALGNAEAVALLLDNGFPEDATYAPGATALHFACSLADHKKAMEISELLLAKNVTSGFVDAENVLGKTALFQACEVGNEALAHLLLEKGADPLRLLAFPGFRFGISKIFKIRIFSSIFSFMTGGVNPSHMLQNRMGAIADPLKRIMLEQMLQHYIEEHPNHTLAKHVLNSLRGQLSSLTSVDKARLAAAGFFAETQLCLIYKFAKPFIEAEEVADEVAEERAPLLKEDRTVREQLGLEESDLGFTHTEDNTMWGSPRASRETNVVNNNNISTPSAAPRKE